MTEARQIGDARSKSLALLARAQTSAAAQSVGKALVDRLGAYVALATCSPLLLLIAIAIKFDSSGPILFRQRRTGLAGRPFVILKFRTMRVLEDGDHIRQATRNDDRVTRIGRFLRRTSLDELPQLVNVLRGEMSLVGPRPHAIAHDKHYVVRIPGYAQRQLTRPGLTGWAQVNGCRGETPNVQRMAERVEHDVWYIDNWSLSLDLRILARTLSLLVRPGDGAV